MHDMYDRDMRACGACMGLAEAVAQTTRTTPAYCACLCFCSTEKSEIPYAHALKLVVPGRVDDATHQRALAMVASLRSIVGDFGQVSIMNL